MFNVLRRSEGLLWRVLRTMFNVQWFWHCKVNENISRGEKFEKPEAGKLTIHD
jgi:hypothetical protein